MTPNQKPQLSFLCPWNMPCGFEKLSSALSTGQFWCRRRLPSSGVPCCTFLAETPVLFLEWIYLTVYKISQSYAHRQKDKQQQQKAQLLWDSITFKAFHYMHSLLWQHTERDCSVKRCFAVWWWQHLNCLMWRSGMNQEVIAFVECANNNQNKIMFITGTL